MPTLHLVDANHTVHRHHHVLSHFKNAKGEPVGALVGISAWLHTFLQENPTDYLVFCFDSRCKWRRKLLKEYKAHRERNTEVEQQLALLQEMLTLYGVKWLKVKDAEADDIIGTLSKRASTFIKVLIHTGDKDMNQLVNKYVKILNPSKGLIDTYKVESTYGIPPNKFADYLALIGDTVDGFSGLPGCGKKQATQLLSKTFLRDYLDYPNKVPLKWKKVFKENKKYIEHCLMVARINKLVPLGDPDVQKYKPTKPDWKGLESFFKQHGLNAALKRVQPWLNQPKKGLFR